MARSPAKANRRVVAVPVIHARNDMAATPFDFRKRVVCTSHCHIVVGSIRRRWHLRHVFQMSPVSRVFLYYQVVLVEPFRLEMCELWNSQRLGA